MKPRPKVRKVWPVPQSARAFMYGYDPYNSVDAHYGYMRAIVVLAPKVPVTPTFPSVSVHNLVREVVLEPLSAETMAALRRNPWPKGLPPRQPWNASRYNKT